jgi:hypothetical protein
MALFDLIREGGGNPVYHAGREAYLAEVEKLIDLCRSWELELPIVSDLEVALELVVPPTELTAFQVGQLKEAMRAELRRKHWFEAERNW